MNELYVNDVLKRVITQVVGPLSENYQSELSLISQGNMTAKEVRMTYTVRNQNLKRYGKTLAGYDELENSLLQLPEGQRLEFFHFKYRNILISLFFQEMELLGYFYFKEPQSGPGLDQ